jgi:hypothetical protein
MYMESTHLVTLHSSIRVLVRFRSPWRVLCSATLTNSLVNSIPVLLHLGNGKAEDREVYIQSTARHTSWVKPRQSGSSPTKIYMPNVYQVTLSAPMILMPLDSKERRHGQPQHALPQPGDHLL